MSSCLQEIRMAVGQLFDYGFYAEAKYGKPNCLLFRQFQEFATLYGHSYITDFDVDTVRRFRAPWPNKNISARKKLEAFRAFFRFVHESGWIPTNPTTPLKPPKITEFPTAPFTKEEVTSIFKACDSYPDKENAVRLCSRFASSLQRATYTRCRYAKSKSHSVRQTFLVHGKNRNAGLLPTASLCCRSTKRNS
jgi:site-specific recombinase XerD